MNLIRTIIYLIWQFITIIPFSIIAILVYPFKPATRYKWVMPYLNCCMWGSRVILGIQPVVYGAENLNADRVILLSKHQSTWETFFFPTFIPKQLCYVFKRELLYVPFFGWGIASLDMIHIDRSKGKDAFEEVVTQGTAKLDEGRWIVMFPEGTRIPPGQQGKYRSGGVRLAMRTGAKIIPVAVTAGECWPKKPFIKKPGVVKVSFGAPIECGDRSSEAITLQVEEWIETEMRRLSPSLYSGPWVPSSN